MKAWNVYMMSKNNTKVRIMKVFTHDEGTEGEAQDEAQRQLSKPGRYSILRQWEDSGNLVAPA